MSSTSGDGVGSSTSTSRSSSSRRSSSSSSSEAIESDKHPLTSDYTDEELEKDHDGDCVYGAQREY